MLPCYLQFIFGICVLYDHPSINFGTIITLQPSLYVICMTFSLWITCFGICQFWCITFVGLCGALSLVWFILLFIPCSSRLIDICKTSQLICWTTIAQPFGDKRSGIAWTAWTACNKYHHASLHYYNVYASIYSIQICMIYAYYIYILYVLYNIYIYIYVLWCIKHVHKYCT